MKLIKYPIIDGIVRGVVTGILLIVAMKAGERNERNRALRGHPQVGDVYASYEDNRTNTYAITNGFPAERVCVSKITAISNGVVYKAVMAFPITNTGQYPFPYNMFGPVENFSKYPEYNTLLKANPK